MDPLTHLASGALGSRAVQRRFPGKAIYPCGLVAAWIPDIDIFFTVDPELYLRAHRGITHSLPGGLFLALAVALLFWAFNRKTWRLLPLFTFAYACVLLHIFLDWVNPYGTMVLLPFSDYRAMLGSVFIIDPFLTLGMLAFLGTSLFHRRKQLIAGIGLAAVVAYPFFNFGILHLIRARVIDQLDQQAGFQRLTVSPDLLAPWYWKLVVEHEDRIQIFHYRLGQAAVGGEGTAFPKAEPDLLASLARQESFLETWLWFAEYPAIWEASEASNRFTLADLRFYSPNPLWQDRQTSPPPFSVDIAIDDEGTLIDWNYHDPSR